MSEWFGKLPERWDILRVSSIFSENTNKNEHLTSTSALQFRYGNIVPKDVHAIDDQYLEGLKRYTLVEPNDIMLNGLNLNYDFVTQRVARVTTHGCITPAYICLRPNVSIHPEYATKLLKAMDSQKVFHGLGTGIRLTLSYSELKKNYLPLPPLEEQELIVRFLNWKVSQINRLINTKKKQIALLQEQKRTVIDDTLPINGDKKRFKNIFTLTKGLNITKADLTKNGIPCISYGQIHSKYGFEVDPDLHPLPFVSELYLNTNPNALMHYGNFVFADTSEDIAGSGNFTYLNSNTHAFAGYHTIIARTINKQNYRYLAYYLDSQQFRSQIQMRVNGVKVYSITQAILSNATIILPSEAEQESIVMLLDKKSAKYAHLIENFQAQISLLQEYRTRLISDVVAGKMNVRGVEIPQYEVIEDVMEIEEISDEMESEDQ